MNHVDLKSEDPMHLKKTIIYLRAELNKYRTTNSKQDTELVHMLQTENKQLHHNFLQLLYAYKKSEKRLRIYEKRIANLQKQNKNLVLVNDQFHSTILAFQSDIQKLIEVVSANAYIQQELQKLAAELDAQMAVNRTQQQLIAVLESYVERLVKEPDVLQTETILEQIIALTEGYAKKHNESE